MRFISVLLGAPKFFTLYFLCRGCLHINGGYYNGKKQYL
ncbi:hypothetical protein CoNPh11_CDS0119 [Staphylococcus phage S-CoN_Ph11]|nr:hypothetical protein BE22_0150 [Staphylococcus phage vB_SepS_BE22]WNM51482.1 hypothetical protein CoNPh1_CDS0083 [Staphylococcus phage S-CoN_Ph1]WNM51630.1 hypothetical protein CoNPh2_CDS0076 [Staphylococcus phage S-CoN_Ph2]WNM51792.1 hypothetical protein CoNPh3_CDS0078 [Staphylococcus phage S-CoN_Ph3]WNM51964.1 hypothetical protein CoNPh4_CDS0088 [Staphylococcus phage S-CoN_Ph4]WNM52147.1 hypothetical protein CoNPh5_CDS0101 [Staphylococcus phage S-CoN_Ph5]WNM52291.1 hypothetical protein C